MTPNPIIIKSKKKKKKKIKRNIKSFFSIAIEFYLYYLYSSSSFFNICSNWNINGWNSEKRDAVIHLNFVF